MESCSSPWAGSAVCEFPSEVVGLKISDIDLKRGRHYHRIAKDREAGQSQSE